MEAQEIAKQMIGIQKTLFDNTFDAVTIMQDYSGKIMTGFLRQFPWVTEKTKKPLNESITFYKNAGDDFKKAIDQGYNKLEELIDSKLGKKRPDLRKTR